jgi:serine/threonine-protein kinase
VPRLAGDAPMARAEAPEDFDTVERSATVVRGAFTDEQLTAFASGSPVDHPGEAPELGEAGSATMARPIPRREVRPRTQARLEADAVTPFWRTRKALHLAGGAGLLLAAMVVGFLVLAPAGQHAAPTAGGEQVSKQLQDAALPTGLTISREASYDPSSGQTRLTVAYAAQKAPLSGEFLEVIPGLADGDACPAVTWDGASVSRNQASITGLDVECGWKVSGLDIPPGGSVQVTAKVSVSPAGQQALDAWLGGASKATIAAMQDPAVKGTAYPVQRLKGVEVRTAARVVTASPLKITLVPVWAAGPDELNPLYVSPASGRPSQMLAAVGGGEKGVRFSDGCGGALAVDSAGLTVTALQITPQCTVRASVGNFTELQSPSFGITSRENS